MSDFFDCVSWRIVGTEPNCSRGLPMDCAACPHRESRNGNFHHPPVYYIPAVHPAMQTTDSVRLPKKVRKDGTERPCCQDTIAKADQKIRGLGDVVAKATSAVGIKPCGGCKKRQEALNKMFPFGQNPAGGEQKSE